MRHGDAEPAGADGDRARRLSRVGRAQVEAAARGLHRQGVAPDEVRSSPLPRALETASIVSQTLGVSPPEPWPLLAGGDPDEILSALTAGGGRLLLVGHEPTQGERVSLAACGIAGPRTPLGTAGCACLEFGGKPRPGAGRLVWFVPGDHLAALA